MLLENKQYLLDLSPTLNNLLELCEGRENKTSTGRGLAGWGV